MSVDEMFEPYTAEYEDELEILKDWEDSLPKELNGELDVLSNDPEIKKWLRLENQIKTPGMTLEDTARTANEFDYGKATAIFKRAVVTKKKKGSSTVFDLLKSTIIGPQEKQKVTPEEKITPAQRLRKDIIFLAKTAKKLLGNLIKTKNPVKLKSQLASTTHPKTRASKSTGKKITSLGTSTFHKLKKTYNKKPSSAKTSVKPLIPSKPPKIPPKPVNDDKIKLGKVLLEMSRIEDIDLHKRTPAENEKYAHIMKTYPSLLESAANMENVLCKKGPLQLNIPKEMVVKVMRFELSTITDLLLHSPEPLTPNQEDVLTRRKKDLADTLEEHNRQSSVEKDPYQEDPPSFRR